MAKNVSSSMLLFAAVCALIMVNTTALKWCAKKSTTHTGECTTGEVCNSKCKAENALYLGGACEEGPKTLDETRYKQCLTSFLEPRDLQNVQKCFDPLSEDRKLNPIVRSCILRKLNMFSYEERANVLVVCGDQGTLDPAIVCNCGFVCAGSTVIENNDILENPIAGRMRN